MTTDYQYRHLLCRWEHSYGLEVEIRVEGDYLYAKGENQKDALKLETYCEAKRDASDWSGKCRYSLTWKDSAMKCVLET